VFRAIKRRLWKGAVIIEFHKIHGLNLEAFGDTVGPGTLDDILNAQYEEAPFNPTLGAKNVTEVLEQSFKVDVTGIAWRERALGSKNSN
jgi:hypothetical protein